MPALPNAQELFKQKYVDTPNLSKDTGIVCLVHGRPKSGKSTMLATYSKFYRPDEACFLDDLLIMVMDNDGLGSLETRVAKDGRRIGVRAHTINVLNIWRDHGISDGQTILLAQLKAILADLPQITCVAVDSLTSMDIEANYQHYDCAPEGMDGRRSFGLVLSEHRQLHAALRKTGKDLIYTCHSRAIVDDTAPQEKLKAAVRMLGGGNIIPAITGQALAIYQRDLSFQIAIVPREDPKLGWVTRVLTTSSGGFEAGSRYQHLFKAEEAFDLGALYQRIREARETGEKK